MSNLDLTISAAFADSTYSSVNRMNTISDALPNLLYLLGASSTNQAAFDKLDSLVGPSGTLSGQSKATPEIPVPDDSPSLQMEFIRPNGETYYARDWNGLRDVAVLQECAKHLKFAYLYGPPGTGKTAMAEAAFGADMITVVCSGDTTTLDLIGQWIPNPLYGQPGENEFVWANGPVLTAAIEGRPLLLDEAGLVEPKVFASIYGLMDGRGVINVTMNPSLGEVTAAPGFYIMAASNPNAPGVNMSEAFLSRLQVHVEVTTDWDLAMQKLGIPEALVGIAQGLSKKLMTGEIDWAPQMRELIAFRDIKAVFGEPFALANMIASAPQESRADVQEALRRFYGNGVLAARI